MKILLILLLVSVHLFSYVRTPFKFMDKKTFQLSLNYMGYSFDQSNTQPNLGAVDAVFRFNDIFFGIQPSVSKVNNSRLGETHFSLGWFMIEGEAIGPIIWSSQLGAYSIGMTDVYREQSFSIFFVEYAMSHYIRLNKWPLFIVWTNYLNEESDLEHGVVVGIQGNNQQVFFEYDGLLDQLYLGFDSVFSQNLSGTIALNISPNQYLDDSQVFVPTFKIGLRVLDVFSTKEKSKPQKPLPIDSNSFMLMEKGLLAYNAKKFDKAANNYWQVTEKYPNFVVAYIRLGNCYYQLKQYELAKKAWSDALKLEPTNDEVFMALIQLKNKEYQKESLIH